jgi:signal transduction histidine kinase
MFEVFPQSQLDENKLFFLEKFTNRIGYNLHQKLLIQQNIEHIKFTNQLVADIEHNVISPNLYYRLFLRKLRKALNAYDESHRQLRQLLASADEGGIGLIPQLEGLCRHLERATEQLEEDYKALANHYEHTSLFLETLLRRDHFEQGRYVLRKQPCNFRTEIIGPLLDRHAAALQSKGIVIDNWLENVPDDEVTLFVDKGLISQVFDNFFSNALKYTQRVRDELDHRIKLVSCSREIQRDYFGEGIHGVRFNFFTTGPPLSSEEAGRIFEEGFRAASAGHERGGGHGLHFVKNVVEIHGGKVGCEPQKFGNQFYFVLPMKEPAGENAVAG